MGLIQNFSASQYANVNVNDLKGITLVYSTVSKSTGETNFSAVNFSGEEFVPKNASQNEVFRCWKNVILTFWNAKMIEKSLKADNGGIAVKLRSKTPSAIMVRTDSKKAEYWNIEESIWKRIGLIPTMRDMEEAAHDYKKKMHKAAIASFTALNFREKFEDMLDNEADKKESEKSAK